MSMFQTEKTHLCSINTAIARVLRERDAPCGEVLSWARDLDKCWYWTRSCIFRLAPIWKFWSYRPHWTGCIHNENAVTQVHTRF